MEFSIKTKTLKNELDKISKLFKKDTKFPMSRALSIEGYNNGFILSARSMASYAKVFVECEVKEPYFFSVDGLQFDSCLKAISEEDIKIKYDPAKENNLIMISGKIKTKIRILSTETHPTDIDYEQVKFEKIPNVLHSINKVLFAACKDETKPSQIMSVFISGDHVVATNGYILAKSTMGFSLPFDAIIPLEAIVLLPDVFKKSETIDIGFTSENGTSRASMIHLRNESSMVTLRTLAKDYMKYGPAIAKYISYNIRYQINPAEFAIALRAAKTLTDKDERISIDVYENGIKFSFENPEVTFEKFIDGPETFINPTGHCVSLAMKLDLAIAFFSASSSKLVDMLVKSNADPIFILDNSELFTAMPLKPLSTR